MIPESEKDQEIIRKTPFQQYWGTLVITSQDIDQIRREELERRDRIFYRHINPDASKCYRRVVVC